LDYDNRGKIDRKKGNVTCFSRNVGAFGFVQKGKGQFVVSRVRAAVRLHNPAWVILLGLGYGLLLRASVLKRLRFRQTG